MLHTTPPITPHLQSLLDDLDSLRSELNHEVGRKRPWNGMLRRDARIDTVRSSTSIEGYTVSDTEAGPLVDGHIPTDDDASRWAVACYARAMEHIQIMAGDPSFRWLDRVILDLHFDACIFQRDKSPGLFRTGPVSVLASDGTVEYTAPDANTVVSYMHEAVNWLTTDDLDCHVAIRAAMAHLHVVSIHPFRDGNGRISRLVQSLVLARDGLLAPEFGSIEPYLAENTTEYYHQLQQAHGKTYDPERDASEWVTFCVTAHIAQAKTRLTTIRAAAKRFSALEQMVADRGWPDRLVIALEQAVMGGTSRQKYTDEADISTPTANLDLRRLIDVEWLQQKGRGRSTHYVASSSLMKAVLD